MDERVMQFRVGVMFLATLIILSILLVMFGHLPSLIGYTYPVYVRFPEAPGVTKDTPVRKSGILIGRVSDVRLTDNDTGVLVTMQIQTGRKIYKNEDCYVSRNLLVGDTALVFRLPRGQKPGPEIASGTTLDGKVSDDPTGLRRELQGPIDTVENTGKALTAASKQLGEAAQRVQDILSPDAQKDVQNILRDAARSLAVIQRVLGDEESQDRFVESMKRLPDTLNKMNSTFHATEKALQKFTRPSEPGGKTPIDRMIGSIEMTERTLRKFSEPSESGKPAPADQIAKAMNDVGEIASLVRSVVARLEEGEGSVGALLKDRQLYDRLNHAAKNLDEVSQRLKPVVEDARVFMDKVARHPGVIDPRRHQARPGHQVTFAGNRLTVCYNRSKIRWQFIAMPPSSNMHCRPRKSVGLLLAILLLAPLLVRAGQERVFQEGRSGEAELKYINDVPVLIVAGTPEEIGRQKAALTAEVTKKLADYPRQLLERPAGRTARRSTWK